MHSERANTRYCEQAYWILRWRQEQLWQCSRAGRGCRQDLRMRTWLKIIAALYQKKKKPSTWSGSKQPVIEKTISRGLKQRLSPGYRYVGTVTDCMTKQRQNEEEPLIRRHQDTQPYHSFAMGSPKQELLMEEMYQAHPALSQMC